MADPRYEDWEGWVPGLCRRMVELPQTNVIMWGIIYCWVYHIMVVYIEEVCCFFRVRLRWLAHCVCVGSLPSLENE